MRYDKLHKISISLRHTSSVSSPHFTFILLRKNIIAFGINNTAKTHPLAKRAGYRFSNIHSELAAIINFPYPIAQLCKYDIVNLRLLSTNELAMSKPCKYCAKIMRDFNIKNVQYSTSNGFKELLL